MQTILLVTLLAFAASVLRAADLSGTWTADVVLDAGSGTATFVFKQSGGTLTGTYEGTFGKANVTGTVKGDKVEWSFDAGQVGKCSYTGTLQGDSARRGRWFTGHSAAGRSRPSASRAEGARLSGLGRLAEVHILINARRLA